jgi:4-hydroxy-tetrahydrodipicolinate synthase
MAAMVQAALDGNISEAEKLDADLQPFFDGEFIQTNPLPIKTAVAWKGMCEEVFRLPMCEMDSEPRKKWKEILQDMNLL